MDGLDYGSYQPVSFTSSPQNLNLSQNLASGGLTLDQGVLGDSTNNTTTTTQQTDPYAQWGGQTAYNNLISGFDTQKQNIYGTANESAANTKIGLNGGILDFIDSLRAGQSAIDNKGVNNELAKRQGVQGVQGMVGRGIKSGGVMLANKNAADSSAAGAIARAYGDIGRRELSGVNNQYELENRNIAQSQTDFDAQRASGVRKLGDSKTTAINNIVLDARNKFAQLDASMADADIPNRLNIEQEKESVRQQILQQLSELDAQLSNGANSVKAQGVDQRRSEATRLAGLGQAPEDAFSFSDSEPAQFQNTGPYASEFPLFTFPRGRKAA